MRLILPAICLLWATALPACQPERPAPSFDEQLARAGTAFVGTVVSVSEREVVFLVEKALRGARGAERKTVESFSDTCGIRFAVGQLWVYLGSRVQSGSLLAEDEYGRRVGENVPGRAEFLRSVLKRFAYAPSRRTTIARGTVSEDCAPWDGPAFRVRLDASGVPSWTGPPHVEAVIYSPLPRHASGVASYRADEREKPGSGRVMTRSRDGAFQSHSGVVWIGNAGPMFTGRIDAKAFGSVVFKSEYRRRAALCG